MGGRASTARRLGVGPGGDMIGGQGRRRRGPGREGRCGGAGEIRGRDRGERGGVGLFFFFFCADQGGFFGSQKHPIACYVQGVVIQIVILIPGLE